MELRFKPPPRDKKINIESSSSSSEDKFGFGKDFSVGKKNLEDIVDKKVKAAKKMEDEIKEIDA